MDYPNSNEVNMDLNRLLNTKDLNYVENNDIVIKGLTELILNNYVVTFKRKADKVMLTCKNRMNDDKIEYYVSDINPYTLAVFYQYCLEFKICS